MLKIQNFVSKQLVGENCSIREDLLLYSYNKEYSSNLYVGIKSLSNNDVSINLNTLVSNINDFCISVKSIDDVRLVGIPFTKEDGTFYYEYDLHFGDNQVLRYYNGLFNGGNFKVRVGKFYDIAKREYTIKEYFKENEVSADFRLKVI